MQVMKDLIEVAGPTGTEYTGPLADRMTTQHKLVTFAFKEATKAGALDESLVDILGAMLENPASMTNNLEGLARSVTLGIPGFLTGGGQKEAMQGQYSQAMESVYSAIESEYKANPHLTVDPSRVGPDFMQRIAPPQ